MMPLRLQALARPRHGDDGIVPGDHAEVAVIGFGRVDEERRCAGRGECRGQLRADMTALADAGDDDAAFDLRHHVDGARERFGQSVFERSRQRRDTGLLGCHRSERRGYRSLPVEPLLVWGSRMHG